MAFASNGIRDAFEGQGEAGYFNGFGLHKAPSMEAYRPVGLHEAPSMGAYRPVGLHEAHSMGAYRMPNRS